MKRPTFLNNECYHIVNRGVAGTKIFKNTKDFLHFLLCLKEYNTTQSVDLRLLKYQKKYKKISPCEEAKDMALVDIISYCIVPDHFHIVIKQLKEKGIILFMQKLGTGFTMYMNKNYHSSGHVFHGKFLAEKIHAPEHLILTSTYIHIHPIKKENKAFEQEITQPLLQKLALYPWSSLSDYISYAALNVMIDLPELKYVKPAINKEEFSPILAGQTYEQYIMGYHEKLKTSKMEMNQRMI